VASATVSPSSSTGEQYRRACSGFLALYSRLARPAGTWLAGRFSLFVARHLE
jgi:hypothetical protein